MALAKTVTVSNGLPLEYHRIAEVTFDGSIGRSCILVHSYLNEGARQLEKEQANAELGPSDKPARPYVHKQYYSTDYAGNMSISGAYEWLKDNVPAFEGAEDTGDVSDEITGDEFLSMLEEVM